MYFKPLAALTADGTDQAVTIAVGASLAIRCALADVELRAEAGSTEKLTLPLDTLLILSVSIGQTIYCRSTAGMTIELAYV
jgi:hypothetical protein